jgi:hypothetical protein
MKQEIYRVVELRAPKGANPIQLVIGRPIDWVRQKYPWESLAVQWAFTGRSLNYKAEDVAEAEFAESFLLGCYNEAFGELPPWNLRF